MVAHKKIGYAGSPETRELVQMICDEVVKVNPELETCLSRNCAYRGGVCEEFDCCGMNVKYINNKAC